MALTKLSAVTRTAYSSNAGDYTISYSITQNNEEKAEKISGTIKKGELQYGTLYATSDGAITVDFSAGILDEDKKLIFPTCVDDVKSIFEELNKQ